MSMICWCGNKLPIPFSRDYLHCSKCHTLLLASPPSPESLKVKDDQEDFYGRQYYEKHLVEDYGFPNLQDRARHDLPERCLFWLKTLLKYKLPPSKMLELGSAHGGFVALMNWAGFQAQGLELSQWLVDFAKETFGVSLHLGPIEEQKIDPASLDGIALMDVIEHLSSPMKTISRCAQLLAPDGLLLIQTPHFPFEKSFEQLAKEHNSFLSHLKPLEHIFLFSKKALSLFLYRLGFNFIQFETAIFSHYDMFAVASRRPLEFQPPSEIEKALSSIPSQRLMNALLDLDTQIDKNKSIIAELELDRKARLDVIHQQGIQNSELEFKLDGWLKENQALTEKLQQVEADRNMSQAQWEELHRQFTAMEADYAARLEVIQQQGMRISRLENEVDRWLKENQSLAAKLQQVEADRNMSQAQWEELHRQFTAMEADYAARLEVIQLQGARVSWLENEFDHWLKENQSLAAKLQQVEADRNMSQFQCEDLHRQFTTMEADYAARLEVIQQQGARVSWLENEVDRWLREFQALAEKLQETEGDLDRSQHELEVYKKNFLDQVELNQDLSLEKKRLVDQLDYYQQKIKKVHETMVFKLMRFLGQWEWLD